MPSPESLQRAREVCLPTWPVASLDRWEKHVEAVARALDFERYKAHGEHIRAQVGVDIEGKLSKVDPKLCPECSYPDPCHTDACKAHTRGQTWSRAYTDYFDERNHHA